HITGGGTGTGLINSYVTAAFGTNGQRTFQVVRVPQYTEAIFSSGLTCGAWDGADGGVLAIDVGDQINLNGATVAVDGLGFRPGAGQILGGAGGDDCPTGTCNTDYVNVTTNAFHGNKGEGIAGTPWYCVDNNGTVTNNGVEGYPNGSRARGAPGNAGGGATDPDSSANDQNAGGGGGGNGGAGGNGGLSWYTEEVSGGLGGAAFAQASACRIIMGGGGGSGDLNNDQGVTDAGNGSPGGGIVIVRTRSFSGTGTITANGVAAFNGTLNDGGGGGGAGGTIIVEALAQNDGFAGLSVEANGGTGGNAWEIEGPGTACVCTGNNHHGPGGGGGGGVVYLTDTPASVSVAGGAHGTTDTDAQTFGSASGSAGTSTTTTTPSQIPGVYSGAQCTPTTVRLESFAARNHGKGVLLDWQTGFEVDNLGFNVYRAADGEPIRINPSLIAGSALRTRPGKPFTAGWSYSWMDKPPGDDPLPQYYLEDIDLSGHRTWHGPIGVDFAPDDDTSGPEPQQAIMFPELGKDQTGHGTFTGRVQREAEAATKVAKEKPEALLQQSTLAGGPAVKISVQNEGWYQISQQQLVAAGMSPSASPGVLQLFLDGSEVPIQVTTTGSSFTIGFYGLSIDTQSTNTNVYWLVWGYQAGLRVPTVTESSLASAPSSFPFTTQLVERTVFFPGAMDGTVEDFFGDPVLEGSVTDESLQVTNLAPSSSGTCSLQVAIQGVTALPHEVLISLNGTPVGEDTFSGINLGTATLNVPSSLVLPGANTVALTAVDGENDISLLDYIYLTYPHTYMASGNTLEFTLSGNQKATVGGFTNQNIRVMDVTNPNSVSQVTGVVQQTGSTYSVTFADPGLGMRTLYAFTTDKAMNPVSMVANTPSNWEQGFHSADMVIIANSMFVGQMAPLATLRESQGLRVYVIDVDALYDDFNFGQKDPQAIESFLGFTQTGWSPGPRFVLMAGKASYDPKNYLGYGFYDLVPTKLVATQTSMSDSDDWFVDFNGQGLPQLAIGRLPARNNQEMAVMLQKTLTYGSAQPRGGALLVCDISDDFDFLGATLQVQALLPGSLPHTLVNRGTDPNAETDLLNGINTGQVLVNYAGHASVNLWRGNFLTDSSALTLTNNQSLPFFVMMTCLDGSFDDPSLDSLSESLLNAQQGGAAFVWASSAITQPASQGLMNQALIKILFSQPSHSTGSGASANGGSTAWPLTMGQAVAQAKAAAADPDVRHTWIFFGDPSMPLKP
ncbi:MAG TPA: C25 family cysteine peptidase, partial [Blastocatellia bacterium]